MLTYDYPVSVLKKVAAKMPMDNQFVENLC